MRVSRVRLLLPALALAVAVPIVGHVPALASPAAASVPMPPATPNFTKSIEPYASYAGQSICSPVTKAGSKKLADLLIETYGPYPVGVTRACSDGGQSEHKEGRALDWMVSKKVPEQRAAAESFLDWLLATDEYGHNAAMARRLGIMYIGWNNKIWRPYDPRGWGDLKGCSVSQSMQTSAYDTYCHRNHIHLSLTWDSAAGKTSFWTNKVDLTPDCSSNSATVDVDAGKVAEPSTLLDTAAGISTPGSAPCRISQPRSSSDEPAIRLRVPVEATPAGHTNSLRLEVTSFGTNAAVKLAVDTAATKPIKITPGTTPKQVLVPLSSSGRLRISVPAGQASVVLKGLGIKQVSDGSTPPPAPPPGNTNATATLSVASLVRPSAAFTLSGTATNVPKDAVVQRQLQVGTAWQARGKAVPVTAGKWQMSATAPSNPQQLVYRARVLSGGTAVARSKAATVKVAVASVRATVSSRAVKRGARFHLSGTVRGVPTSAKVVRFLRVGSGWERRGDPVGVSDRKWRMAVDAPSRRTDLMYKVAVKVAGEKVAHTSRFTVRVR